MKNDNENHLSPLGDRGGLSMEINEYRQLKAFAVQDGTLLGLIWILCLASFVWQLSNPSISIVWIAASIFSIGFAFIRVKKFGTAVKEGELSFGRAWFYSIIMFVCASILMALATYIYFAFIDKGFIVNTYFTIMDAEESKALLKGYDIDDKTFAEAMQQFSELKPIDWTMNILSSNIILGMILSPIIALYAKQHNS